MVSNDAGLEMDIRDLKFDDNTFDVAIDKGMPGYSHRTCIHSKVSQEQWMP